MNESDDLFLEVGFLVYAILNENKGMTYQEAERQAVKEIREERDEGE